MPGPRCGEHARLAEGRGGPALRKSLAQARFHLCRLLSFEAAHRPWSAASTHRLEVLYDARDAVDRALESAGAVPVPAHPSVLIALSDRGRAAAVAASLEGGLATAIAGSGLEALEAMRRRPADVLVWDPTITGGGQLALHLSQTTACVQLVLVGTGGLPPSLHALLASRMIAHLPGLPNPGRLRRLLHRMIDSRASAGAAPIADAEPGDSGAARMG